MQVRDERTIVLGRTAFVAATAMLLAGVTVIALALVWDRGGAPLSFWVGIIMTGAALVGLVFALRILHMPPR